jgi:RES domain-containing protein
LSVPLGWDADRAIAGRPLIRWRGRAWRAHRRRYEATDHTGSLLVSGRFHRAADLFPPEPTWPALYLALDPETTLGEILRHIRPERLPMLNEYRITEIGILLSAVLDCRDLGTLGLPADDLWHDLDYEIPQSLAAAAIRAHAEAILVPSATRLGDNLVLFPTVLRPRSRLEVRGSRDPMLYVDRG